MVKSIDGNLAPLPDHIGWRLWQANRAWLQAFVGAMRAAGHEWFSEARAGLIGHIPRRGIGQSALIERVGTSKQAVQQILDGLEAEGIIERITDPADARAKFVRYTDKGLRAVRDGDSVKRDIERRYVDRLGRERFAALMAALRALDSDD